MIKTIITVAIIVAYRGKNNIKCLYFFFFLNRVEHREREEEREKERETGRERERGEGGRETERGRERREERKMHVPCAVSNIS